MMFEDRIDAALQLIPLLSKYKQEKGIILAVPRGGVPVGFYVARALHFPLEILLVKKIGHPSHSELAIGAVSLENEVLDPRHDAPEEYVKQQIMEIRQSLRERYRKFMGDRKPLPLSDKTVIIIDDGIATGNTILAAIKMIRSQHPAQIIVAVPVAPYHTVLKLKEEVDDLICVYIPESFFGVGQFYRDFSQVSDEDVVMFLLAAEKEERHQGHQED